MNKEDRLLALARSRRADRLDGYRNISDYHDGAYDVDFVTPWSKVAHDPNASVMVIAQDWASDEYLGGPFRPYLVEYGYDPNLPTNTNLHRLLDRHFGLKFPQTFATNLFPFVKAGGMSSAIRARDFSYAAGRYLLPQIEIVSPELAICLGSGTYNAVRRAAGLPKVSGVEVMLASPFAFGPTTVVGVVHTGRLGTNHRGAAQVELDWARMSEHFSD